MLWSGNDESRHIDHGQHVVFVDQIDVHLHPPAQTVLERYGGKASLQYAKALKERVNLRASLVKPQDAHLSNQFKHHLKLRVVGHGLVQRRTAPPSTE